MELLENQVRALYRLLGHGDNPNGYSDCRCIIPDGSDILVTDANQSKMVNRSIIKGESSVIEWARRYNGQGNCYIGRSARASDGALLEFRTITADIDPNREHGTAATLELSATAIHGARAVLQHFRGGYVASSGNGALIIYRLQNPVTADFKAFEAKYKLFEDEMRKVLPSGVTLDATFDTARLVKLLGTVSTKGNRANWRHSRFLDFPILPYKRNDILEGVESCSAVVKNLSLSNFTNTVYKSRSESDFALAVHYKKAGLGKEDTLKALKTHALGRNDRTDDHERICAKVFDKGISEPIEQGLQYSQPGDNLDAHRERLFNRKSQDKPELSIGVELIDRLTWGLRRGEVFTIAARPSIGKTSIAVAVAARMAREGKRVLFFTSEMSTDTTYDRLLQVLSGVPGDKFNTGDFTDEERSMLDEAYEELKRFGELLTICDSTSPDIQQVTRIANKVAPDLVIYDHIQHIGGASDSARDNVSKFMRGLKDIARSLGCAVLALSQIRRLYRDIKTGKEMRPSLSDLKESGTIEEESGAVLLLSILSDEPENPIRCLYSELAKNRYGPLAIIGIEMNKLTASFKNMEGEPVA
jgi:replicative DNA helicase